MGRVFREGQTKPVYVYRMIAAGTIEESIFQAQQEKNTLNVVVHETGETAAAQVVDEEEYTDDSIIGAHNENDEAFLDDHESGNASIPAFSKFSISNLTEMLKNLPPIQSDAACCIHSIVSVDNRRLFSGGMAGTPEACLGQAIGYDFAPDAGRGPEAEVEAKEDELLRSVCTRVMGSS